MKNTLKTAGVQFACVRDREKNLAKARSLIEVAAGEGAKIIGLPQLFNSHWFPAAIDEHNFSLAEDGDGATVNMLREESARHKVCLVGSIFEIDNKVHYNTAFVTGPDGAVIGRYRKVHVPQIPLWEEKTYFSPGDLGFPVFKTPFATIGVQICWDIFFPEGFRILALKGAQMVFAPTASAFIHSRKKWERAIGAAAHANGIFIFRVNRVGKEEAQEFYGGSFCAGPDGEFVGAPSGASDGVVLADVDLSEMTEARNEWVFLRDRRPEEYGDISGSGR
ncbi:MAG: nitrilase-related carbon-nitrogen hydrolase [Deltaproteobacteria bacterium]